MGLLIMVLPPAEILLTIWSAGRFGWSPVLLALGAGLVLGMVLLKLRGRAFLKQANAAMLQQQMPTEALVGGIAWYVAGILLIIPGFITDLLAVVLLLPPVRRRLLDRFRRMAEERLVVMQGFDPRQAQGGFQWPPQGNPWQQPGGNGDVFEGEAQEVREPKGHLDHVEGGQAANDAGDQEPRKP